ncbi:nucleoside diphosphate kinase [Conidiobolus coronatus NRRL 28638]|uniref:Nucleoside diphosphate kinase n=1 Tax=Conidiobolus coronatus (strain ATCC 28846 / CBS 209.66 / NRRL 28638) TaxID=796925 RepID=A0A137PD85_CONC2|nr:nucleoside diphosphate kinase [Conidiobolus coronatus NRRL 28638]|eukprot:KXN72935.1 nucleoside diphosphate kinase [Conidiobolus coronatus NRRL 28638]
MNLITCYLINLLYLISISLCESTSSTKTFAMIKPDGFNLSKRKVIFSSIKLNGLNILREKVTWLTKSQAKEFYKEHEGRAFFDELVKYMTSGPVTLLELEGSEAIKEWRTLIGPTDPKKAKLNSPSSLRARKGIDLTRNLVHGSDSNESAKREIEYMFSDKIATLPIELSLNSNVNSEKTIVLLEGPAKGIDSFLNMVHYSGLNIVNKKCVNNLDLSSYFGFGNNMRLGNDKSESKVAIELESDKGIIPVMNTFLYHMNKPINMRYYTSINNNRYKADKLKFFPDPKKVAEESSDGTKCDDSCQRPGIMSFLKAFI